MGAFTKGDIVLFPFPFTDLSNRKLRPCLVLSNIMRNEIILCQITSKKIMKDKYCVEIKKNSTITGSLKIDSYVRANMIFTADTSQIITKICKLSSTDHKKVIDIIIAIIGSKV